MAEAELLGVPSELVNRRAGSMPNRSSALASSLQRDITLQQQQSVARLASEIAATTVTDLNERVVFLQRQSSERMNSASAIIAEQQVALNESERRIELLLNAAHAQEEMFAQERQRWVEERERLLYELDCRR